MTNLLNRPKTPMTPPRLNADAVREIDEFAQYLENHINDALQDLAMNQREVADCAIYLDSDNEDVALDMLERYETVICDMLMTNLRNRLMNSHG